jgi:alpha-galactosidase
MKAEIISKYTFGDMTALYYKADGTVALSIVPNSKVDLIKESKLDCAESLVQIFTTGDDFPYGYSQGITMRNSPDLCKYIYKGQTKKEVSGGCDIVTTFDRSGRVFSHHLVWSGGRYFACYSELDNSSGEKVEIQMMASFSLGGLTPFIDGEAPCALKLHRMRSYWSEEGRMEDILLENLGLAASWGKGNVKCERFGQLGAMPVRKFFPFAAIEDTVSGVTWAAQIKWAGSWQIEAYRKGDQVSLSGGLADYEFGHFKKSLAPGDKFKTPVAFITVAGGGVDTVCERLLDAQEHCLDVPESEEKLPVLYNEYCDTWGNPNAEKISKQVKTAKLLGLKYFVIDAGWYGSDGWWLAMGDWAVCEEKFPKGIKYAADIIRNAGLIPGIWFEFECVGVKSQAFSLYPEHFLKRDGKTIISGDRAFWDFRDPWVIEYLSDKVIKFLKENGFGYIKVDYNDTFGIGCDSPDSLGEGLRRQVTAMQDFFRLIKKEIPDIIIENCASGGHRLEPSMMELVSMASFSDAHELKSIPIIAANLHRAILPRQSQIWAVLRPGDSERRLIYSLVNTCLGRMCLSGNIYELSNNQLETVKRAIAFYKNAAPVIKEGSSYRFGPKAVNYNFPEGWQCVVRLSRDGKSALAVFNAFGGPLEQNVQIEAPRLDGMEITAAFSENGYAPVLDGNTLTLPVAGNFSASAALFTKTTA